MNNAKWGVTLMGRSYAFRPATARLRLSSPGLLVKGLPLSSGLMPVTISNGHSSLQVASRRVLFLNANETMKPYRVAPLGLAFVASAVRAAGHDVQFLDYPESYAERA